MRETFQKYQENGKGVRFKYIFFILQKNIGNGLEKRTTVSFTNELFYNVFVFSHESDNKNVKNILCHLQLIQSSIFILND